MNSASRPYISTMNGAGMFHRIWRVTCSFICAPSEKPVAKVPRNRVFNQTIADEFNPLQLSVPVSVARVTNWRDSGGWVSDEASLLIPYVLVMRWLTTAGGVVPSKLVFVGG